MTFSGRQNKSAGCTRSRRFLTEASDRLYVHGAHLAAVLRVGLDVERDLLALGEGAEAVADNAGEMYEHIVSAFVVGNEAIAFALVKPFYCTVHVQVPPKKIN